MDEVDERVSTSGSVVGQHAVAEVEDVPGAARPGVDDSAARVEHDPVGAKHQRRVEIALHGLARPIRRTASSSGTRQSTPTTSAPAVAHRGEQLAGADAEVDARHAEVGDRREHRARVRHARTRS